MTDLLELADVLEHIDHPVMFTYRNWRGEVAVRLVAPVRIRFAATEWHPEPQWLLEGLDLDKHEPRSFALADICDWKPIPPDGSNRAVQEESDHA